MSEPRSNPGEPVGSTPQESFGSAPGGQETFGSAPAGDGTGTFGSAPPDQGTFGTAPSTGSSRKVPLLVGGGIAILVALAALIGFVVR